MVTLGEWVITCINWLLTNGGSAVLSLWGVIKSFFGGLFAAFDIVLNPVLSPLLSLLNPPCTKAGDVVYALLDALPVWLGLTLISAVVGVVVLVIFRYTSNQPAIGRAKDDIKANLLALKLYKDELRVMFQAQGRLLWAIARLQRYVLTPVIVMALPMLLGLAQMGIRYQWRPLRPGERTLVKVILSPGSANPGEAKLEPNPGAIVEVGPVPGAGDVVWRIRGGEPGRHTLRFDLDGRIVEKQLVVGRRFQRVSAIRPGRNWTTQLLHPVEPMLPVDSPAQSIEILYPSVDSWIYGADYWVLYFFVISMLVALVLRPVFKVRF